MHRVLALTTLLAACGGSTRPPEEAPRAPAPPPQAPPPPEPEVPVPPAFEGTAGVTDVRRPGPPARLVELRTGRHEGFDRLVFEFADRVPGYHVAYVDRPVRACGSGDVVEVAGDGWLEVRLEPADAHDEEGHATVHDRDRLTGDLANVRQLVLTCDFEAQVAWVAGTGSPEPYRVIELEGPPRLVVDIRSRR